MSNKEFQEVYPFTTESITGYITEMDMQDKKVLTVGSSCDQALNSLLMGASEVTIFDINERVKEFYELKRKLIFEVSREKLVDKILDNEEIQYFEDSFTFKQLERMNLYLQNDENYQKLREILERKTIKFINGNIFDIPSSNINGKYDRVILSNVLQYLSNSDVSVVQEVYKIYSDLSHYLNNDSIVQLYYLYGSIYPKHFIKVINEFDKNGLSFERISCDERDSAILVKRRTNI